MTGPIIAYKGFDKDLKCRGFQYEVGKSFEHDGPVEMCGSGFHACQNPSDVLDFYPIENGNRFAVVEMDGDVRNDDKKSVSSKLNIKAELSLCDFIKVSVNWHISGWFKDLISKKDASTGNYAHNASTGNYAHNASTGDDAHNASTGNYAHNASTGDDAHNASTGYRAHNASTGNYAHNASTGDDARNASTGNYAHNASTGNYAHNASTGNYAHNASTGDDARNASTGDNSSDQTMGDNGVSASLGRGSKVKGALGTPIALVHYDDNGNPLKFVTGIIGKRGLKADTWYMLTDGKITEVED